MKQTELKRKTALKRTGGNLKRTSTAMSKEERESPERAAWLAEGVRQRVCAVTKRSSGWNGKGKEGQPYQVHHALYEQVVERHFGDAYTLAHKYDTRNALRVATQAHRHHHDAFIRIPLKCLRDENIEYAFEILGRAAYGWLTSRYAGHDERVGLALAELEAT